MKTLSNVEGPSAPLLTKPQWEILDYICFHGWIYVIGLPAVTGRVLRNRFYLSFHPSICLGVLLEFCHQFLLYFGIVPENQMKLRVKELNFLEMFFHPQNWENRTKIGQKLGFFKLLKNLVLNIYWICSIMKIYIICCVPAKIRYLGKFLFLIYGLKNPQPIRLQDFLLNHISRTNQWNSLFDFVCWYQFT